MHNLVLSFAKDETGTTMVEYGVMAAGICLAIGVVVAQIDGQLNTPFETLLPALKP